MKFCPSCGKKLVQPNPKYCPECGKEVKAIKTAALFKAARPAKEAKTPRTPKEKLLRAAIAVVVFVLFIVIAFILPSAYWDRAEATGAKYYEYATLYGNDATDLSALSASYADITLSNATLDRKAALADTYALKASQALPTWGYFESFLSQNNGFLQSWNVSAPDAARKVSASKATLKSTANSMYSDLKGFAGEQAVDKALNDLGRVPGIPMPCAAGAKC